MKEEGLQVDLLPTDIAEVYEEVDDMTEGFSKQDKEIEQVANNLFHANTADFYSALPETSLLKKQQLIKNGVAGCLLFLGALIIRA